MSVTRLEKELIKYTKGLPKEALLEILDFIQFIREKKLKKQPVNMGAELTNLDSSQQSHLEEEFQDYKKVYPLE